MLVRKPRIYTTYFGKLRKLPKDIVAVAVCRYPPTGFSGYVVSKLAPDKDILMEYKRTGDWEAFKREYESYLNILDKEKVRNGLLKLGNGHAVALVCFEKDDNCHRHLIASWLGDVEEWKC